MPRQLRLEYPGAIYHVMTQGARREPIFRDDAAKRLTNVTSQAGSFAYTFPSGIQHLVSRIALPNGSYISNTYDTVARLTGTYLKNSSHATLDSSTYVYNAGNQRTNRKGSLVTFDTFRYFTTASVRVWTLSFSKMLFRRVSGRGIGLGSIWWTENV